MQLLALVSAVAALSMVNLIFSMQLIINQARLNTNFNCNQALSTCPIDGYCLMRVTPFSTQFEYIVQVVCIKLIINS